MASRPSTPSPPTDAVIGARTLPARIVVWTGRAVARVFGTLRDLVARGIIAAGFTANTITLIGPIVAVPLLIAWYRGEQRVGAWLLLAAGSFDMLDGAVARLSGKVTTFGAFLDSVMDRFTDAMILAGIFLYLLLHTSGSLQPVYLVFWAFAMVGTLLPSYVRARSEKHLPLCKVGFLERAERTVTVFLGALFGNLHIAVIILACFGNLMVAERILYTREELDPNSRRWGKLIWRYPRLSPPHVILCATLIAALIWGHHLLPRP